MIPTLRAEAEKVASTFLYLFLKCPGPDNAAPWDHDVAALAANP